MEWQDIYLFISSTFNDMHAERDYLVKHVFPELSAQCEKYRLRVIDIDLRWGITTADSEAKNTVRVCLEHIDKCRPFFLCFLGQRRGWVPDESDLRNACTEYPRLSAHAGKDSVTEMEVEHALLSPMYRIVDGNREELPPAGHALFFFREDTFTHLLTPKQRLIYTNDAVLENKGDPAEEDTRLARFKEKVRKSRRPVTPYSATWVATIESPELLDEEKGGKEAAQGRLTGFTAKGADLKHGIIAQILAEISAAYPDRFQAGEAASGESAQAKELEQQELFIRLHSEGYIPRADATGKLDAYMNSRTDGMCLLTAGAGLGKTMMLANYVLQLRKRPLNVYARFCGVSDLSSDPYSLWQSLLHEAGIESPPSLDALRRNLPELLDEIARKGEAIILIDAVNQIQGGLEMLLWLPEKLPGGLKLIVSLKKDAASERLLHTFVAAEKNVTIETLPPFEKREERERLIHDFLGRYFKALDDRHIDTICNLPYADNPLFLNILLHELRVFGTFRQLDRQIGRYGETPQEAFEAMLGRLESDPAYDVIAPEASVPFLFGLLAHARRGLSENELASCFAGKFPDAGGLKIRGTIRFYLRQVRPFMAQREGRTDFFYESFLLAARAKYAKEAARLQKALSDCFLSFCDPLKNGSFASGNGRALTEYAYHLMACDECEGERLYENIPYLTARCSHTAIAALLEEYGRLGDTAQRKAQEYRQAIFRYAQLLSAYPDALPSLLYLSGTDDVKAKLLQAQEEGKIKSPWLKADLLPVVPAAREEAGESGLYCRVVAEHEFTGTSAVTIAQQADLAFYSLGRGKIGVADTASLVPYGTIIPVSAKSIVSLRASDDGTFLVAGFEDGTAEVVKLTLSDAGLMAKAVHTFSYLLPYGDTGIFVFESNEALWYQGVNGCLNRLPLSGDEAVSEAVSLPVDGDITSLCIGSGGVCYSVWRKGGSVLFVLSPIDCRLLSRREFTGDDVVVMGVSGTFFVAASMQQHPDYGVYLLDANLNAVHRAGLPSPVAACCEYGSGLFIIPRTHVSKTAFLWDYDAGALSTAAQPFSYQSQLFVKANRDHTLTLISHLTLTRFDLQTGRKPEAGAHSMEVINKGTRVHILKEKIREHRFPVDRGLIKDMCYSPATGKAYIFFEHPPDGIFSSDQFVTYGTIEDFLNEREKHAALHCSAWSPNRFAALAEGDDLLILSDGIITVHALDGLRYKTALSAEEPIRQMGKDESGGEVFALIGESKTTKLTIIN